MINSKDETKIKDNEHITAFRSRMGMLRTEENIAQEQLSELLGVSRQTIWKYEKENTTSLPDIAKLCILCDHFGVSPNYLLGYSSITCDQKKNFGLSDRTINLLNSNPNIHQFLDFFVEQLVNKNLDRTISQIGIKNNVEKAWEMVFPKKLMNAINKAYFSMVHNAAFSASINSSEMEKELRRFFPMPESFTEYYNKNLNQDGQNFILQESPNFSELSDKEKYDCFVKIISSLFVEIKSIQYVYHSEHERVSQKIIDIISDYVELINTKKCRE